MLREMLGMAEGILQDLHQDHEEVSGLIEQCLKTEASAERNQLFKEIMSMLLAHSEAEQNVLYKKMQKSDDEKTRSFVFEGLNEHQIVEQQLPPMSRARNKASEQWTAQLTVLRSSSIIMSRKKRARALAARAANSTASSSKNLASCSGARKKS